MPQTGMDMTEPPTPQATKRPQGRVRRTMTKKRMQPISVSPVSYTHLDVYKRQNLEGQFDLFGGGGAEESALPELVLPNIPEFTRHERMTMEKETTGLYPVSYTHLDVYKTQPRSCPGPPGWARHPPPGSAPAIRGAPERSCKGIRLPDLSLRGPATPPHGRRPSCPRSVSYTHLQWAICSR